MENLYILVFLLIRFKAAWLQKDSGQSTLYIIFQHRVHMSRHKFQTLHQMHMAWPSTTTLLQTLGKKASFLKEFWNIIRVRAM